MTHLTRVFLVLLRLAIGWHFLFEGLEKVSDPSWSSEPYLRESSGPLAPFFRGLAGDPTLERLTPLAPEQTADGKAWQRFPPLLDRDWQIYQERFVAHYRLDEKQQQDVEARLRQQKENFVTWLETGKKTVARSGPSAIPLEVEVRISDRVQEYQDKVREARRLQDVELAAFGPDVNPRLRSARTEANRLRSELNTDLAQRTADMQRALLALLGDEQKKHGPLPEPVSRDWWQPRYWTDRSTLEWIDWTTRWGLVAVGLGLLLGLFSRTACLAGAAFLLLFYLAMPPWPGTPENLRAEGHYLLINKNIIEMLALLVLATTASGRWAGLDALIAWVRRGRRQPAPAQPRDPAELPHDRVEPNGQQPHESLSASPQT